MSGSGGPRGLQGHLQFLVRHAPRVPFLALSSSQHSKGIMKMDPTVEWELAGGDPNSFLVSRLDCFGLEFLVSDSSKGGLPALMRWAPWGKEPLRLPQAAVP